MTEYKSKYINKTWNEITTSFDWVNCQPVNFSANCNCKHAFSKALINKMITSFKINATIF